MGNLMQAGKAPHMLVVLVNGMRASFYVDAADGSTPVESVIVKELMPHIDKTRRRPPNALACSTGMPSRPIHNADRISNP